MELQKKDQKKKIAWSEAYLKEVVRILENNSFYNRNCQFPQKIKLPITRKECLCELGGMQNQFGTVLLVSTPTGGYPVGMALYDVKPNGVQATVKAYEKSYVGIATRHCDYLHVAIYRISDMCKDQEFKNIDGYSFGFVEATRCYYSTMYGNAVVSSDDEFIFSKNKNLKLLKNKLLQKIKIHNCDISHYIEPLTRLNSNTSLGIFHAIDESFEKSKSTINWKKLQYSSDQLELFYSDFMNKLKDLQSKHQFVYVKSQTSSLLADDTSESHWYTLINIFYNDNGEEEPLRLCPELFIYKHTEDSSVMIEGGISLVEKNLDFMRQFTRSYFMTLFGFKSWKHMDECKEDKLYQINPSAVYSKYYLTTKQFFSKREEHDSSNVIVR